MPGGGIFSFDFLHHVHALSASEAIAAACDCKRGIIGFLSRILLLVIVLIAYGCLYPFHFAALPEANPVWVLLHSWDLQFDRFLIRDVILNVLLYVPLGVSGYLALARHMTKPVAGLTTLLLGCALSTSVEVAQV